MGPHASTHASGGADPVSPAAIGAVATNDSRLTDARAPTAHKASHASGGADALSPGDIGAVAKAGDTDLGTMAFADTKGVKFWNGPLLSGYDVGVWTPELSGATSGSDVIYERQLGWFIRTGDFVWVTANITASSLGTIFGTGMILGLPYSAKNTPYMTPPFQVAAWNYVDFGTGPMPYIICTPAPGQAYLFLERVGPTGRASLIVPSQINSNFSIMLSGWYQIA